MVFFFTSLGVGAGVPVQISPDVRVGGRLLVDAHLAFGVLASVDLFPAVGARPWIMEGGLFFKLSL